MKSRGKAAQKTNELLQIDAETLKEKLDRGEDIFILDVRTPAEHAAWKLSYDKYGETPVIPVDKLARSPDQVAEQIPRNKEIVTLCAHGMRSQMAAGVLSKMGYRVKSIRGGMAAWNQVYDVAKVPINGANDVRVWQLRRVSKGCMAYVIASGKSATVIDSTCDLDSSVLRLAKENDLKIVNVIDTHMHADHVSGLSALAKNTGAKAFVGASEGYEPPNDLGIRLNRVKDGHALSIGTGTSITVIHTPGHTEGSLCFLLESGKKGYLFTGDTLFVNGVGRPDLHSKAREFASNLYNTYQKVVLKFPDDTAILPAHFDTSSITVKHGEPIVDTLGSIKKKNKLLSMPKDEFVGFMVSTVPPRPANYEKIVRMNKNITPCDQIKMGDLEEGPNSCAIRM
ncbi:MAG TPA: MBL fold metallo-hydrolase [Nitrososphaera sp.]|jgi:glyoxylase-like metal-dependent hydrolase (beta-lactamase superfamily II)/rhodanese-related sulfurtransferase